MLELAYTMMVISGIASLMLGANLLVRLYTAEQISDLHRLAFAVNVVSFALNARLALA